VLRDYRKIQLNPYSYGKPPKESDARYETPFSETGLRMGVKTLVRAGAIAATVDGPLPFGDAVAIALWSAAGVAMIGYGIYGFKTDLMESRGR
jgi:hypothetical protein